MSVSIKIGKPTESEKEIPVTKVELNIRKTLDGDIMIFDHADIDIIIMKDKKKIVAFPKDIMSEVVYGAQDRLFKFLLLMCAVIFLACVKTLKGKSMRASNLRKIEFNSTFGSLEYPRTSITLPIGGWCFSG